MDYLWVGVGSALGGMARHGIAVFTLQRFGPAFPWGTLTVNILGSFLIGLIAVLAIQGESLFSGTATQRFVLVGVLGGFTTFSSFSLQTLQLLEKGNTGLAVANILVSLTTCLLAVGLGARIGKAMIA